MQSIHDMPLADQRALGLDASLECDRLNGELGRTITELIAADVAIDAAIKSLALEEELRQLWAIRAAIELRHAQLLSEASSNEMRLAEIGDPIHDAVLERYSELRERADRDRQCNANVQAHLVEKQTFVLSVHRTIRAMPTVRVISPRKTPPSGARRPARRRKLAASGSSPPRLPESDDPSPRLVDVRIALGLKETCHCGSTGGLVFNGRCWMCGDEMLTPAERSKRTRNAKARAAALTLCPCGCDEWFTPKRPNQVYADPKVCPQRAYRRKKKED